MPPKLRQIDNISKLLLLCCYFAALELLDIFIVIKKPPYNNLLTICGTNRKYLQYSYTMKLFKHFISITMEGTPPLQ